MNYSKGLNTENFQEEKKKTVKHILATLVAPRTMEQIPGFV